MSVGDHSDRHRRCDCNCGICSSQELRNICGMIDVNNACSVAEKAKGIISLAFLLIDHHISLIYIYDGFMVGI